MRYPIRKLAKGLYDYRGFLISFDSQADPLGWFFVWNDSREYFQTRAQAQRQIDRYHYGLVELTAAPTNAQLAALDLGAYVTDDLLFFVQKALADQGIPRSRSNIASHCNPGYDGPVKRLMLRYILSSLLVF